MLFKKALTAETIKGHLQICLESSMQLKKILGNIILPKL